MPRCAECGAVEHEYQTVRAGAQVRETVVCPDPAAVGHEKSVKRLGIPNDAWCSKESARMKGVEVRRHADGRIALFRKGT